MADVFVSYTTADRERVKPIVKAIEAAGFSVWWDRRIELGSSFDREIERELDAAACVMVVWSKRSIESDWVRNEAQEGLDRGVLLPILIDHVRPPLAFRRAQTAQLVERTSVGELNRIVASAESIVTGKKGSRAVSDVGRAHVGRWPGYLAGMAAASAFVLLIAVFWWLGQEAPATHPLTSIAVLPFEDLSPTADQGWLARGMTEALRVYLSRVERLRVTQASSDASADQPNVGSKLYGSVQRVGDNLVVTSRLVSTADGVEQWSARYDLVMDDVLDLQREIVREIVGAIEAELGIELHAVYDEGRYGTSDVRAYELWRKALELKMVDQFPSEESLRQALQYNLEAVAIDPEFPQGYVGLGTTYQWLWVYTRDLRDRVGAQEAFERAVALDPSSVFARGSLAQMYGENRRWSDVVDQIESVDPWIEVADVQSSVFWYIVALVNLGRWEAADSAVDQIEHVYSRFPGRYLGLEANLAISLAIVRGDYAAAINVVEQRPPARGWAPRLISYIYHADGRGQDALAMYVGGMSDEQREVAIRAYTEGGWLAMLRALEPWSPGIREEKLPMFALQSCTPG